MDPKNLPVATWDLASTSITSIAANGIQQATESFCLEYPGRGVESVFGSDARTVVDLEHIRPGGKYRSIVKLFIRYKNQAPEDMRTAIGTGWLIAPDILVTAGHCVYDWGAKLGRAVEIKAYLGYNGRASVSSNPDVQFRTGVKVCSPVGWITNRKNKDNDIGFVRLNAPFTGITSFKYEDTPMHDTVRLGVVGYPGDKVLSEEKGAQMYEMWLPIDFNRNKSDLHMLDYTISTFAGQSGSPVFMNKGQGLIPIGVHTYGGAAVNSATAIGSPESYGNPISHYVSVLTSEAQTVPVDIVGVPAGIKTVKVTKLTTSTAVTTTSDIRDEEGFIDFIKDAIQTIAPVAKTVLSTALPFAMGPVGVALAPLANIALTAAAKATESQFGAESAMTDEINSSGAVERAILGEAAIDVLFQLDHKVLQETGALKAMQAVIATYDRDRIKRISPQIMTAILEPGFRIALDHIDKLQNPSKVPFTERRALPGAEEFLVSAEAGGFSEPVDEFIKAAVSGTSRVQEESFFEDVFHVIKKGAKVATPFLTGLAREGLDKLDKIIGAKTEAGLTGQPDPIPTTTIFDQITQRALLGEAALQGLMKIPPHVMAEQHPVDEGEGGETESLWDSFKGAIQKIGPIVKSTAPLVLKTVGPLVQSLMSTQLGESAMSSRSAKVSTPTTVTTAEPASRTLRAVRGEVVKKRSFLDVLSERGHESGSLREDSPAAASISVTA